MHRMHCVKPDLQRTGLLARLRIAPAHLRCRSQHTSLGCSDLRIGDQMHNVDDRNAR